VTVNFTLNGQPREADVPAVASLLDVIRGLGLTGTKAGCGVGVCGVCTVLVDSLPVSSCLYLAHCAAGAEVWTVEGIARSHPEVVDSFVRCEGMQCGICTPGQVVAAAAARLEFGDGLGEAQLREYLIGNLCRCTGYATIIAAATAANDSQ
jgi:aerobic-type carbon monoxide dehydrogenase small subunit (CoxS/CutS family)